MNEAQPVGGADSISGADQVPPPDGFAALVIESLECRNFRGITSCRVELEADLTVLVGRNNAGKSRILRALAIGLGGAPADADDLTVEGASRATIDIVLAPRTSAAEGHEVEVFDDALARRLEGVHEVSQDPSRERFAWRTTIRTSEEGFGVRADRHVMVFNAASQSWELPPNPQSLNREQSSLVAADLVDTHRDLAEELNRRATPIRRVLSDLEIDLTDRTEIEIELKGIGQRISQASRSLGAVKDGLEALRSIDGVGVPDLQPLPVRVEELARAISIEFDSGNGSLPIRLHGAGPRSLASLQIQRVLYDRRLGRDGTSLRPLPVSLIEEPEAHLHPQAQFELAALLLAIGGQVVVSSHSAHLASVVEPRSIRIIRPGNPTDVIDLHPVADDEPAVHRALRPLLHVEEMEKLRRLVERPFGELLFASAVVLGDGATERSLLPPLIRHKLGNLSQGVCTVDPASMNSPMAEAVVKFANLLDIPWLLFSDSDASGKSSAKSLDTKFGDGDESHIIWVGDNLPDDKSSVTAIEQTLLAFDEELCIEAAKQLGYREGDILNFMSAKKGSLGAIVAQAIIKKHAVEAWPPQILELIERLRLLLIGGASS